MAIAQVEQGESEHAAQLVEAIFAPLFPGMDENFGVGLSGEAMAAEKQSFAQLAIVVELTVEEDGCVVSFIPDGLIAAGQIDDAEAAHAEGQARGARIVEKKTFVVGSAVLQGGGHGADTRLGTLVMSSEGDAANAAHAILQSPERKKKWRPRERYAGAGGNEERASDGRRTRQA